MQGLVNPSSIALVGGDPSRRPGLTLLENLRAGGYAGEVTFVHPRAGSMTCPEGVALTSSVPPEVDVALLLVGASRVPLAYEDCLRAGARSVIVMADGVAPGGIPDDRSGPAGLRRGPQAPLVLGPNTIGYIADSGRIRLSFQPLPDWQPGGLGMLTQTGLFAGSVAVDIQATPIGRLGIHQSIDVGNNWGACYGEVLRQMLESPDITAVGLHAEDVRNLEAVSRLQAEDPELVASKPVVVWVPGRTPQSQEAIRLHTDSMIADHALIDAWAKDLNLLTVEGLQSFRDFLGSLQFEPRAAGARTAVLTLSGCLGVYAADLIGASDLRLATPHSRTRELFADAGVPEVNNPYDIWGAIANLGGDAAAAAFRVILEDPETDQLIAILLSGPDGDIPGIGALLGGLSSTAGKPVHCVVSGEYKEHWASQLEEHRVPTYESIESAVNGAVAKLHWRRRREWASAQDGFAHA